MLRSFFSLLSKSKSIQKLMTNWQLARKVAGRFIAGETIEQAIEVVVKLNEARILATVDQLGENTLSIEDAFKATEGILESIEKIAKSGVKANISVKLSQIGLALDDALCKKHLGLILLAAKRTGNFIRIDMEDAQTTSKTIAMFKWALAQGFEDVGIVIQSYLFRSEEDIEELSLHGSRVRLCKGAYKESATIAFPKKVDVDKNYDKLARSLLLASQAVGFPISRNDGKIPPIPAIATHDINRIAFVKEEMEILEVPKNAVEYQMLYGIRRDLQEQLVKEGYQVRVYVPFGTHWFPYFMRRLAERPANVWFFVSNFFKK